MTYSLKRSRPLLCALCAGMVVAVSGFECGGGTTGGGSSPPAGPPEIVQACCSGGTPANYLKTNDDWSPTTCGSPTSIVYNVCTYRRFDNKPSGSIMVVCSDNAIPAGWVLQGQQWSPTSCGHPSSIVDNLLTFRKL